MRTPARDRGPDAFRAAGLVRGEGIKITNIDGIYRPKLALSAVVLFKFIFNLLRIAPAF